MAGGLGLGGPMRDSINPQLSPVGPAQEQHVPQLAGPSPNAPVQEAPSIPGQPPTPGLPTGRANPVTPPGIDMQAYRSAMLRRINAGGANPGQPPGRPPLGTPVANDKADIGGMLRSMMATRNTRRVLGG